MLKKITSAFLGILTLCTLAVPAMAAVEEPAAMPEIIPSEYVQVSGEVLDVDRKAGQVTIELSDGSGQFVLNVDENTAIVNNATRKAMKLSGIKKGSFLFAWHSQAVTRSIPPQSYAYAITANVKEDVAFGTFFEAAWVERQEDGSIRMLNDRQDLYVTLKKGTSLRVLGENNRVKLSEVHPGDRLFVWLWDIAVTEPAMAATDKAVILPCAHESSIIIRDGKVLVDGKTVAKSVTYKGEAMVPVELVGKALGFTAEVDERQVTLTMGDDKAVFEAGKDMFTLNGEEIGITAPAMRSGRLHVGLDAIAQLGDYFTAQIIR